MSDVNLALIGLGEVGSGLVRLLDERHEALDRSIGRRIRIKHAVVRDLNKTRQADLSSIRVSTDPNAAIADPEVSIVVELTGAKAPAFEMINAALKAGKDVVTANKALLAEKGLEIFQAARRAERTVCFEGAVGGGVPIVAALGTSLASNKILSLRGILNGTTNFILSRMFDQEMSYEAALRLAQELGFAEADPTLDVTGADTAQKLAILCRLAFQTWIDAEQIRRQGIDRLSPIDLKFASDLGYVIKLVASAAVEDGSLRADVSPTLTPANHPLSRVTAEYNMVQAVGGAVGEAYFMARGAGGMPTASSVLADVIDLATGRAQAVFESLALWEPTRGEVTFDPNARIRSRFYLRFMIQDSPGTLAQIAGALGRRGVSIASVIQRDSGDDKPGAAVPLIVMTHAADENRLREALAEADSLGAVEKPTVCLRVAEG